VALPGTSRAAKTGLAAQTVTHHHKVLREALKQAVRWQLLAVNPADAVKPPRAEHKEIQVLDETGAAELLGLRWPVDVRPFLRPVIQGAQRAGPERAFP